MRYGIKIKTKKGVQLVWVNGGFGYTKEAVDEIVDGFKKDSRVVSYTVYEM